MTRRGLMLALVLAAAGCGQTGELFLPGERRAPGAEATPATPGEEDTTTDDDDEEAPAR